jgi:hypothetical protein
MNLCRLGNGERGLVQTSQIHHDYGYGGKMYEKVSIEQAERTSGTQAQMFRYLRTLHP